MTSAEEAKYIILPTAAVVIIASLIFSIGSTASKAVEQSSPQQHVSTAEVKATTPKVDETPEEKKKKEFDSTRSAYGYLLTEMIKKSAYDPDALKIDRPKYFKNGVCVSANGKNRFGAYVGFQEYCYLVDDKGVWKYRGP